MGEGRVDGGRGEGISSIQSPNVLKNPTPTPVARQTSHVTRHPSHVTRHTAHAIIQTSCITPASTAESGERHKKRAAPICVVEEEEEEEEQGGGGWGR